jgi:hypothetical protein
MAIIRRVRDDERDAIYTIGNAAAEAHRDVIGRLPARAMHGA